MGYSRAGRKTKIFQEYSRPSYSSSKTGIVGVRNRDKSLRSCDTCDAMIDDDRCELRQGPSPGVAVE
jgi:hypothetical protein